MASVGEVLRFAARSTKRVAVIVLGAVLLAGGLVMMVTPGPGLVLIIAGLAVLATEFAWAAVLLDKAKETALAAKDKASSKVPWRKRPDAGP